MTAFDTAFKAAAVPCLFGQFGESLTYRPAGGGTRSITGMVTRDDRQAVPGLPQTATKPTQTVVVYNDSTTGIAATEINTGGDSIDVPVRFGVTATSDIQGDAASVSPLARRLVDLQTYRVLHSRAHATCVA